MNKIKIPKEKIPQNIVTAYNSYIQASKEYEKALKTERPKPPFSKGDKLFIKRYPNNINSDIIPVVVKEVCYDPYSVHPALSGWRIILQPATRNFVEHSRRSAFWANKDMEICKA